MVPIESIRTTLFGYSKGSVAAYLTKLNDELSQRLQQRDEAYRLETAEMQERIAALEAENAQLRLQLDADRRLLEEIRRLAGTGETP